MATGRRDYTGGYLLETGSSGRYIQNILDYSTDSIGAYGTKEIYSYPVLDGYRFALQRVIVSTKSNVRCILHITTDIKILLRISFDCNYDFMVSDQSPYYIEGGHLLSISFVNYDEIEQSFYSTVIGVLEQISE